MRSFISRNERSKKSAVKVRLKSWAHPKPNQGGAESRLGLKYLLRKKVLYSACKENMLGFPGGAVVENPPANAGDKGSIPDPGRSHMPWSS